MTRSDTTAFLQTIAQWLDAKDDRIDHLQLELDAERRAHADTRQELATLKKWPVLVTEGTDRLENG